MGQYSSYYLYQKYERRGSQDWIPCTPNVYSITGDSANPMPFVEKSSADTACGYVPPTPQPQYRWKVIDGYVCDDCGDTKIIIQTDDGTIYINGTGAVTREEVSAYTSAATSVVITNKATSIAQGAFMDFANMEFCRIPNTVTSIGESAFYRCTALQECQIPNGVTTLARSIFHSCVSLAYMDIPSTVTSIGDRCFASCLNFRYVSWPREVTVVPEACFLNADGMSDIELPSTITEIEDRVFEGCNSLYSVTVLATTPPTLGSNVFNAVNPNLKIYVPCESLSAYKSASGWNTYANRILPILNGCDIDVKLYAIYNNGDKNIVLCDSYTTLSINDTQPSGYTVSAMTSAEIGDCVTTIGNYAFDGCKKITNIDIPDSVTSIGQYAFRYCSGLTSIDIPSGVTAIGRNAFYDCYKLRSIEIPTGVTSIDISTFSNCSGLTRMNSNVDGVFNIPNSVTSIGSDAFNQCYSLTSVRIPDSVTSIGSGAFFYCSGLTSIDIPSGVTSISNYVFSQCTNITSVTIPTSVTSIGEMAFFDCYKLTNIDIPDSVVSIGERAFDSCVDLTTVNIGSGVTSIGSSAFSSCYDLVSLIVEATTPPILGANAFIDTNANLKIYVPSTSVNAYKAASGWSEYTNKIYPIQ